MRIHRFCVSHIRPLLPDSWYDDCIALGGYQPDSPLHVRALDPFWHEARPIAYGAAGTHVLPIAIERFAGSADLIEISSCRKRIFPAQRGVESKAFPSLREVRSDAACEEIESSVLIPPHGFLTAWPLYLEATLIRQYKCYHPIRDLLDYTSIATELGFLDNNSAVEFLDSRMLIPGGAEVGIFPRAWAVPTLSKIARVSREFLVRHGDRIRQYDDYQIRAVGFLSERLGSYFLLRHLMDVYGVPGNLADMPHPGAPFFDAVPGEILGHMTVVTEGDAGYVHGTADRQ